MMDFSKYEMKIPYPKNIGDDFLTARMAKINETPMTTKDRDAAIAETILEARKIQDAAAEEYRKIQADLYNLFHNDAVSELMEDFGIPRELAEKLLYEGYERGHSGGIEETYYKARGLAELAKCAYEIGKEKS